MAGRGFQSARFLRVRPPRRGGAGRAMLSASRRSKPRPACATAPGLRMQGQDQAVHLDRNCIASASTLRWPSSMMGKQTSSSNRAWYSRMQS